MRILTLAEIIDLHRRIIERTGGSHGVRDIGALESAVSQPAASFGSSDLYPSLVEKVAALGFSLIQNHPFVDGNKRIGHAAMELTLMLNGFEFENTVDESELIILAVASGRAGRDQLLSWLQQVVVPRERRRR
jgi:death-on-curing protein